MSFKGRSSFTYGVRGLCVCVCGRGSVFSRCWAGHGSLLGEGVSLSGHDEILHLSSFIKPTTHINYHKPSDLQQRTHTHTYTKRERGPTTSHHSPRPAIQLKFNSGGQILMLVVSASGTTSQQSLFRGRLDVSYCWQGVLNKTWQWEYGYIDHTRVQKIFYVAFLCFSQISRTIDWFSGCLTRIIAVGSQSRQQNQRFI